MKDLLEALVRSLVDHPDEIVIDEVQKGETLVLKLHVNQSDMGKVIGRSGRIAKAIRTVMKAASVKTGQKVAVDICDDDEAAQDSSEE